MSLALPDVSEFQTGPSAPDWAGIKKQNGGAGICRVGYGNTHLDHMFVSNYTAMKANKFSFLGLYHYLVAGQDAAAQASQFCKWVGPPSAVAPGTVFMLDLEEGNGDQSGRALTWLTLVDTFYGLDAVTLNMRSWLYSYTSFVAAHNLGGIFASNRRTWVAAYQVAEPALGHTLWQSTDGTSGSNITNWAGCGKVDTSIFHGDLASLAAMGWGGSVTPPPAQFHGEYVTAGMYSLADLCSKVLFYPTNTVLRMTAVHYGAFMGPLGPYIDDIMTGKAPWTTPLPKGTKLWCD